jgi:hypothetical protein
VGWSFGTVLWSMLAFFFWFMLIWMFIAVFADILRRHMSGWAKAGWIMLLVLVPFFGCLVYLIARPKEDLRADERWTVVGDPGPQQNAGPTGYSASEEIARAARLQAEGKITADEYARLKAQALSS